MIDTVNARRAPMVAVHSSLRLERAQASQPGHGEAADVPPPLLVRLSSKEARRE
jgi:hypothetical protein